LFDGTDRQTEASNTDRMRTDRRKTQKHKDKEVDDEQTHGLHRRAPDNRASGLPRTQMHVISALLNWDVMKRVGHEHGLKIISTMCCRMLNIKSAK
jgi:hypothetical protein